MQDIESQTEQTEPTARPWRIGETDAEGHFLIESADGATAICYGAGFYGEHNPSKANGELIVRAVNEWDERQRLEVAAARLLVGITGVSTSDCEWHDGLRGDAFDEVERSLIALSALRKA